jgi:hypothetical protein
VPIGKQDGEFVATSSVDDYRYQPLIYSSLSVYEWTQCSSKKPRNKQEKAEFKEKVLLSRYLKPSVQPEKKYREAKGSSEDEDDGDYECIEESTFSPAPEEVYNSDWCDGDDDWTIVQKQELIDKVNKPTWHPFTSKHDLYLTHAASCNFRKLTTVIPNFIGSPVPRADKGDRSFYCMTMLSLFKLWRSPGDLKDHDSTWEQAFDDHAFTEREMELLSNFNMRYECNDARDDHFAAMKKKLAEAQSGFTSHYSGGRIMVLQITRTSP